MPTQNIQVRELTDQEKNHQLQMFILAERVQGEIAQRLRRLLGEPAYDQKLFDEEQRKRRVTSLMNEAYGPVTTVEQKHDEWIAQHVADDWTYGPEFKPDLKQHPNLKPWAELPTETQIKIEVFALVASFTRDAFTVSIMNLSRAEEISQLRVLLAQVDDEEQIEGLEYRLSAILALLDGSNAPYIAEVLERVYKIADGHGLVLDAGTVECFEEALTVGR